MEPTENWLPIPKYEGIYEASDQGNVRSLDRINCYGRRVYGRVLKPALANNGYLTVYLCRDGKRTTRTVHSIIAQVFIGERPAGLDVLHRNGDRLDVRAGNLGYGTRSENILDEVRHGVHNNARKTHCKRGHEFTPENTRIRDGKWRECRTCTARTKRAWEARQTN